MPVESVVKGVSKEFKQTLPGYSIEVLELETGLQCAEFAGHVGGLELARLAAEVGRDYNNAWIVVERNNHGSGVLAHLGNACRYEKIYCQGGRRDGEPGWLTTSLSRPAEKSST